MKISELIQKYHIHPKKMWGQHFLSDYNIQRKMIEAIGNPKAVLEIGPGLGILTEPLLEGGSALTAVEKDPEMCEVLNQELKSRFKSFELIHEDVLKVNFKKILGKKRAVAVGNLPYNITSPILFHLIEHRACFSKAYLTMQKEVADRLTAQPGSKDYGRLTLSVRFFAEVEPLFVIHPNSFFPPPQVQSEFVCLTFHKKLPPGIDPKTYLRVVQVAFSKRRKQLGNVLADEKSWFKDKPTLHNALRVLGISAQSRAEELGIREFLELTRFIQEHLA